MSLFFKGDVLGERQRICQPAFPPANKGLLGACNEGVGEYGYLLQEVAFEKRLYADIAYIVASPKPPRRVLIASVSCL